MIHILAFDVEHSNNDDDVVNIIWCVMCFLVSSKVEEAVLSSGSCGDSQHNLRRGIGEL